MCSACAADIAVPKTYRDAMRSEHKTQLEQVMRNEIESLAKHETWVLIDRSSVDNKNVIANKWVYTVKQDEHGIVKRFKAHLVVIHGFEQRHGINYFETFAPVIRFESIRAAIYYAMQRGWLVLQYGVKTAFLHGTLQEQVVMEQPQGFGTQAGKKVCRLVKSLYGLKQAPYVWNQTLHKHLNSIGFTRLDSDYGLYARQVGGGIDMLLTVYVDDLMLLGEQAQCEGGVQQLQATFELTSLGLVKYMLSVEVIVHRRDVLFTQRQYVAEQLQRFHMTTCNTKLMPEAENKQDQDKVNKRGQDEEIRYRELVGALQ